MLASASQTTKAPNRSQNGELAIVAALASALGFATIFADEGVFNAATARERRP